MPYPSVSLRPRGRAEAKPGQSLRNQWLMTPAAVPPHQPPAQPGCPRGLGHLGTWRSHRCNRVRVQAPDQTAAELLGLEESDDDDDDRSILSAVSFSARCVPIDEDERPRSAGSTVSFRVRPTSPASVVSEDIEADATWCGNWRSRRAAQEPEDEMDVTSLRTALALARRDAAARVPLVPPLVPPRGHHQHQRAHGA